MNDEWVNLWTIADEALVRAALAMGHASPCWSLVQENWKPAYRWILERMHERGVHGADGSMSAPPLWAWHSCGRWQRPPDRETIDSLLGMEPQNRKGLVMVSWRVPENRILLSRYAAWCGVLDHVVDGRDPEELPANPVVVSIAEARGSLPLLHDDLQATVMVMERDDIQSIVPLEQWQRSVVVAEHESLREVSEHLIADESALAVQKLVVLLRSRKIEAVGLLGSMYSIGWGVPRNLERAERHLRFAALRGDALAARNLSALEGCGRTESSTRSVSFSVGGGSAGSQGSSGSYGANGIDGNPGRPGTVRIVVRPPS